MAAAGPFRDETALGFVPDDDAFFGSVLRLRQQFDAVVQNRAFARLRDLPALHETIREFVRGFTERGPDADADEDASGQPIENDFAPLIKFWNDPANQPLISLLADALSHEVFIHGDRNLTEFTAQAAQLNSAMTRTQLNAIMGDDISSLARNHVPTLIEGCVWHRATARY